MRASAVVPSCSHTMAGACCGKRSSGGVSDSSRSLNARMTLLSRMRFALSQWLYSRTSSTGDGSTNGSLRVSAPGAAAGAAEAAEAMEKVPGSGLAVAATSGVFTSAEAGSTSMADCSVVCGALISIDATVWTDEAPEDD